MSRAALAFLGTASLVAATLAMTPTASATAVRHASPTGAGTACTQVAPCSLAEAVTNAADGDTVQLTADEYTLTAMLDIVANDITIQGPAGVTNSSSFLAYVLFSGIPDTDPKIRIFGNNVHFQRLAISGTTMGSAALIGAGGSATGTTYDRVRISNAGGSDTLVGQDVTLTNSFVRQDGAGSSGSAVSIGGTIMGSTIYSATGSAINFDNAYQGSPNCTVTIRNSLVWGGGANLRVNDTNGGGSRCASLTTDYDYSWIPDPGGPGLGGGIIVTGASPVSPGSNVLPNTPVVFDPTDPASTYLSDFVLPVDSPAIDAGCTEVACSDHDYYGRPRPIGRANDIGVMEQSLRPAASPVTARTITTSRAGLSGTVVPRGAPTTYRLQYRRVGASSWTTAGSGTVRSDLLGSPTVSATARSLNPGTRYETALAVSSARGSATSETLTTFRTAAAPTAITVNRVKATVTRRKAKVTTTATTSTAGRLTQTATTGSGRRKKTRCTAAATATSSGRYTLTCNLGKKGRKELRRKSLKLTLVTTLRPTSGATASTTNRVTVKRKR